MSTPPVVPDYLRHFPAKPEEIIAAARAISGISDGSWWTQSFKATEGALLDNWRGLGADSAKSVISAVNDQTSMLQDNLSSFSNQLGQLGAMLETARSRIVSLVVRADQLIASEQAAQAAVLTAPLSSANPLMALSNTTILTTGSQASALISQAEAEYTLAQQNTVNLVEGMTIPHLPTPGSGGGTAVSTLVQQDQQLESSSALSAWQQERSQVLLAKLPASERATFDQLISESGSSAERAYLEKALAAGEPMSAIVPFANAIRGKSNWWLADNLHVVGQNGRNADDQSPGLTQDYSDCGAAAIETVRAEDDPIFALWLNQGGDVYNGWYWQRNKFYGPSFDNKRMEADQVLTDDQAGGHINPSLPAKPGSNLLNQGGLEDPGITSTLDRAGAAVGVRYQYTGTPTGSGGVAGLQQALSKDMPVPLDVGPTIGAPNHVVVALASSGQMIEIHDSASGYTGWVTDSQIQNNQMNYFIGQSPGSGMPAQRLWGYWNPVHTGGPAAPDGTPSAIATTP